MRILLQEPILQLPNMIQQEHNVFFLYLGGSQDELPHSMIVNSLNELFVFGTTGSADFL